MRRQTSILAISLLAAACAGKHRVARTDLSSVDELLISELNAAWRDGTKVRADSTVVVMHLAPTCLKNCGKGVQGSSKAAAPRPAIRPSPNVVRFITDSLHARFAPVAPPRVCDSIRRSYCKLPPAQTQLTMTVPALDADTIIIRSVWDGQAATTWTQTMYLWVAGHWKFPVPGGATTH